MNATNERTTFDRWASPFLPPGKADWTQSRQIVREICVERARAVFLATRWTVLLETAADSAARTLAETTRLELKMAVRRYARLLLALGEPRSQALLLVAELAAEVARHNAW